MVPYIVLTAVLCLPVGFTLGMVAKPADISVSDADTYPLKESRNA